MFWESKISVLTAQGLVVGDLFRNAAHAVPDRVAAVHGDAAITFGELDHRANAVARTLDVGPGDRVAVWSSTDLRLVPLFAALAKAGAVFVPVSGLLPADEAAAVVASARPALLVADEAHADDLGVPTCPLGDLGGSDERDLDVAVHEGDPHVIFFTSGSTGAPKGVVLSHRVGILRCHPGALLERRGPMVCPYPLFHMGAWTIAMQQWAGRDTVVFTGADAPSIVAAVGAHAAERLNAIPGVWRRILDHLDGGTLPTLRFADTGTSATPPDLLAAMRRAAPNAELRVFYGSTEAGSVAHLADADIERKPGSCGVPAPLAEVRVDNTGEVLVRGPLLFDGYFDQPDPLVDGWYATGDLADLDDEGYLSIVGRVRDVIRTGGESVSPAEVEAVLATHPAVQDVAVVGLPDPQWGEVVCAAVVGAVTLHELTAHCDGRLARFKVPRRVVAVDAIPRTPATNQVQRRLLVEQLG